MSKRSNFDKVPKEFYRSIDPKIGQALAPYVRGLTYASPCYGEGDLEDQLMDVATCKWRSDIRETVGCSEVMPVSSIKEEYLEGVDCIIENPPFSKDALLPILDHLLPMGKPMWLLLPWDHLQNGYMKPYVKYMQCAVPLGRLYWFENEWICFHDVDNDNGLEGYGFYMGWWDHSKNKPAKSKFTRGTDNYCWLLFDDRGTEGDKTVRITY